MGTISWLVYLVILSHMLNLLLWTLFAKGVDYGAVAWFTLIHPVESLDAIGVCGTLAGGESGDA